MQMTLETLGQLERRLNVAVPLAQIEGEVAKRLERIAKTAKIAGFRPGKVPLKMVMQQYGPQVRSDVISDTVQSSLTDAIREQKLRVAGYPRIEPRQSDSAADQFEFSAVFEVYPDVVLGDLSGAKFTRPVTQVTPVDVDHTIEILRKQRVNYEPVARVAGQGDRVTVDFTGTIDGVEFAGGQARDFAIVLGEGRMLPEFERELTGAAAGDKRNFELTFPDDYHGKEVAGKRAAFDLTVKTVSEGRLPELDDAFVREFGIASAKVEDLRAEIRANLNLELKRKVEAVVKEQVMEALQAQSQLAVPRALVEMEEQNLLKRAFDEVKGRGGKPEDSKLTADMFRAQAEQRVQFGLILNEIVRQNGLQPRPEQIRVLVEEASQSYEQPEAVVRWHYEKPERLNEFEVLAVERNVVDWALSKAQVEDRVMMFAELMEPPASVGRTQVGSE